MINFIFYRIVASIHFYFSTDYSKYQAHMKVNVKITQYQSESERNQFSVGFKCSCDLCVKEVVRLRWKGILVSC